MKQVLEEKKKRLSICKPKWENYVENKIKGDDKCTEATSGPVGKFELAMGELKTAKDTYFTLYEEWVKLWAEKWELDKMCKAKSSSFLFSQKSQNQDQSEIDQLAIWEKHFNRLHSKENLLKDPSFQSFERAMMLTQ